MSPSSEQWIVTLQMGGRLAKFLIGNREWAAQIRVSRRNSQ